MAELSWGIGDDSLGSPVPDGDQGTAPRVRSRLSTVLIGLVPTYATIGICGAVALTALRLLQGFGVGGE